MMNPYQIKSEHVGAFVIIGLFGIFIWFLTQMKPEHHNYEIHGADGKVYHTTSLHHGTSTIWFTDENGNGVELGGGYTVIRK